MKTPFIILLDLKMPVMDGLEFLETIRKEARHNHIKVFILTTSGLDADKKRAEELGVTGFILKDDLDGRSMEGFIEAIASYCRFVHL